MHYGPLPMTGAMRRAALRAMWDSIEEALPEEHLEATAEPDTQARIRDLEQRHARLMSDYITEQRKGERLERENARLRNALQDIYDLRINDQGYLRPTLSDASVAQGESAQRH